MKILRLTGSPLKLELHPDSALLPDGRPMFYPDFGSSWQAEFYTAVRISRLGKGIAPRFASRYYDALTLAMVISPSELSDSSELSELSDSSHLSNSSHLSDSSPLPYPGWLNALDNSITHGSWTVPGEVSSATVSVVSGSETVGNPVEISMSIDGIDAVIERLSLHTTLRNGDLILLPTCVTIPLTPRTRIIAPDILNVKIV
ncbi:MAG: hypothetical protein K2K72_08755 [Duncaniella sp.]|nr:hypothetical protein [Duncaniella sp.]